MQNILNVKYKLEEQAKTAFSQAQMQVNTARAQLDALVKRRDEYELEKQRLMNGVLDILKLNACEQAIQTMAYHVTQQQRKVAALEAVLDNARRKLNEAMMERKTHEKLKENEFQDFLQELNEQEKKEIDEVVSYQFNKSGETDTE
jgi:flagellar FliJ protein